MEKFTVLMITLFSFSSFGRGILGQLAPEFNDLNLRDTNGKKVEVPNLKNHKGKFVILKFWQSWCPGCLSKGLPDLKYLQNHFKKNDKVKLYSVQTAFEGFFTNTKGKVKEIRNRFQLTILMAHDDGKGYGKKRSVLMDRFKTGGTPWYIIINPEGVVIFNDFHLDPKRVVSFIEKSLGSIVKSSK